MVKHGSGSDVGGSSWRHPEKQNPQMKTRYSILNDVQARTSQILHSCSSKPQRGNSLVHQGKLQHQGTQQGSGEYPHIHLTPLSLGNSRVEKSPASLQEFGSRAQAASGGDLVTLNLAFELRFIFCQWSDQESAFPGPQHLAHTAPYLDNSPYNCGSSLR